MENNTRISESATVILRDCLREPRLILSTVVELHYTTCNSFMNMVIRKHCVSLMEESVDTLAPI